MNIQTGKGMGIVTQKGMGISNSKGMGLSKEKNYFKFNEYERQRRYFFGDRGKGNNKKKPQPKPVEKKLPKQQPKKETPEEKPPEPKPEEPPKKEPEKAHTFKSAAIAALAIMHMKAGVSGPRTTRLPPLEEAPRLPGNTLASMQRMLHLFN